MAIFVYGFGMDFLCWETTMTLGVLEEGAGALGAQLALDALADDGGLLLGVRHVGPIAGERQETL